jgi:small subunit ribosomal protein S27Ae
MPKKEEKPPAEAKKEQKVETKPASLVEEAQKEAPKPEKAKREKKKKISKKIFKLYQLESDKIVRLRPVCERCGPGYFMADHGNRYTCGHCGFTRYKPAEK